MVNLLHGDCLELMKGIPDNSVDMVLCDLPYGTTACKWDSVIPFEPLWEQYKRICKSNAAIVLNARQPFTSRLIMSNIKNYKHKWVWDKRQSGSWFNAKFMPLQIEEDILVFCFGGRVNYYPIMRTGKMRIKGGTKKPTAIANGLKPSSGKESNEYYPTNILTFPNCSNKANNKHPTQKPVPLLEYLIKTYSNEGDVVLDNTMGSGSTGVACVNTGRDFIGIELDDHYFSIAEKRIAAAEQEKRERLF